MLSDSQGAQAVHDLSPLFRQLRLNNSIDSVVFLASILPVINSGNAAVILGLLQGACSAPVLLPEHLRPSFLLYYDQIARLFADLLPRSLTDHLPAITFAADTPEEDGRSGQGDVLERFQQLIIETLARTSFHEIMNALNRLRSDKSSPCPTDTTLLGPALPFYLSQSDSVDYTAILRSVALLAAEVDVPTMLGHFGEAPTHAPFFFLALKLLNPDVYRLAAESICSEKKHFRVGLVGALPEIDIAQVIAGTRDYNWEVLERVICDRPDTVGEVVSAFREERLKVSRKGFLEGIAVLDAYFVHYVDQLELTTEEMAELGTKSRLFSQAHFQRITDEELMASFCQSLVAKSEPEILEFAMQNTGGKNFPLFLRCLCSAMRLSGELKAYVIDNFAHTPENFHTLITYLGISEIETLLGRFYQPEISIEALLRKYHPQELLIEIHRFNDSFLAAKLISECTRMPRFCDRDWVFAMKSLESINTPVKMKTCFSLLRRRPQLRSQIIILLKRSINQATWHDHIAYVGLIKCLEALESDCAQVMCIMEPEEVGRCLRESESIRSNLVSFLNTDEGAMSERYRLLRECIRRF